MSLKALPVSVLAFLLLGAPSGAHQRSTASAARAARDAPDLGVRRPLIPQDDPNPLRWTFKLEVVRGVAPKPVPDPASARALVAMINQERVERRLPALAWYEAAVGPASKPQTERMQATGRLFHNADLDPLLYRLNLELIGENVGYGRSVDALHNAFMASPTHRSNILDPGYRLASAYAMRDIDGSIWVTVNFLTPLGPR